MNFGVWNLRRALRKLERQQKRDLKAARGRVDEQNRIEAEYYAAYRELEKDIAKRLTADLLSEAQSLRLPTPRYEAESEDWWEDEQGYLTLRPHAFKALRDAIREERRARFEVVSRWVTLCTGIITMLVGLTGALIGLISVWKKH